MADIVAISQTHAEAITADSFTFYHGERDWLNVRSDEATLPVVYLDAPISSTDTLFQSGYIESAYPLKLLFLRRAELDYTPEQHRTVINAMRVASSEFLRRLQADNDNVRNVRNVKRTDIINIFDQNLSGVLLEVEVVPFETDSSCL